MILGLFGKKKAKKNAEKKEKLPLVGRIIHYFPKVKAAVVRVEKGKISVGDQIRVKGHTTDFDLVIKSMQIDHEQVEKASKGQEAAIKVKKRTRIRDKVFMLQK